MRVDYFLDTNKIEQKKENKSQTALSNIEINTLGCGACKKYDYRKPSRKVPW